MATEPRSAPSRRRRLSRAISRVADASVVEALAMAEPQGEGEAWRIGVTGPPGVGKSSLITRLGQARLERLGQPGGAGAGECLGILAIDPSSPVGGGAILGDRVRMDALASDPRVYVRSLASRGGHDGLAHNIVDLLALADSYGFEEVMLETVGVGQSEHAARALVDSLVLVLHPEAGDSIQAMKSGLMEVADIYVVNKADLPGAARTAAELNAVLKAIRPRLGWTPPVIQIAQGQPDGVAALDAALEAHRDQVRRECDRDATRRARRRYHLQSLLQRRIEEILSARGGILDLASAALRYEALVASLGERAILGSAEERVAARNVRA
jgi:LAO/AO transport system kinase